MKGKDIVEMEVKMEEGNRKTNDEVKEQEKVENVKGKNDD